MSDPLIGARLGNYQIESSLGRGGMARVYRAYDVTLRRMVALKVIEPDLRDLGIYSAGFEREAQILARLEHLNIVSIYYFGESDGLYYIVMRFIDGVELRTLMDLYQQDKQSLPSADLLRIFQAVGSALDYAHAQGVIHRDVKPSNIMIDRSGQPYLTDFGLALNVSQGTVGEVFSTPHYIAPEQVRSSANAVPQSDFYSLGVILYELFTGVVPFDDPVATAVALQHITKEPTPPHVLNPELAPSMEMVILKAIAKNPEERFQSGDALNQALSRALQAVSGIAHEGPPMVERVSMILAQEKPPPDAKAAFSGSTPGFDDSEVFTDYPQPSAPGRSRGLPVPSIPLPTFGSKPSVSVEPVEFTGFWPKTVQPKKSYALMVFAHVKGAASEVRDVAAGFAEMMGGSQTSGSAPSQVQVAAHTLLTFVPQIEGLTFQPAEQSLIWEPSQRFQSVTFLFNVPTSDKTSYAGRILIFEGPLVIGEIPVTMVVAASVTTAAIEESPLHRIEPIFASYSHHDTPVIEYFRKTRSRLGQKMLVDVYDLRAGEHWADRLLQMIDESVLFQLFWSEHSAESEYVKREWQHALKHLATRPRFIQPVWWDMPMHPPPPELAHLHFQRIGLPPVTRLQVALRKVRGLLGR